VIAFYSFGVMAACDATVIRDEQLSGFAFKEVLRVFLAGPRVLGAGL
jgi:hypothetical protein